jgi:predicted nucleic acid-binding protein
VRTAVDTNIISALWSRGPLADQAFELMKSARLEGQLLICSLVYTELVANPAASAQFVDSFLSTTRIDVDFDIDRRLCREAGARFQAHARRRQRGRSGAPRRIVADFLIGMHAILRADRLLTFDTGVYRRDFPELVLGPGKSR